MHRPTLLCLVLAGVAACSGASPAPLSAPAQPEGEAPRIVSSEWVQERPSTSPWEIPIPASRKPRWYCRTEVEQPERSSCARSEAGCKASPGEAPCDPHARAACFYPGDGRCFPTVAICEAVSAGVAAKRGVAAVAVDPTRGPPPLPPAPRTAGRAAVGGDATPQPAPPQQRASPSHAVVAADPGPSAAKCAWSD